MKMLRKYSLILTVFVVYLVSAFFINDTSDAKNIPNQVNIGKSCDGHIKEIKNIVPEIIDIKDLKPTQKLVEPMIGAMPGEVVMSCYGTAYLNDGDIQNFYFYKSNDSGRKHYTIEAESLLLKVKEYSDALMKAETYSDEELITQYGSVEWGKITILEQKIFLKEFLGKDTVEDYRKLLKYKLSFFGKETEKLTKNK